MQATVHVVVLVGIGGALPLALGGRWRWWLAAATAAAAAFAVPPGPVSAALILPFAAVAAGTFLVWWRSVDAPREWGLGEAAAGLARGYTVVAAAALVQSRLGWRLFGLGEPIVELTAVHYMFAGCAALVLAARRLGDGGAAGRVAVGAVVLTGAAPPVVAAGFVTGAATPQVGGALLVALGVCTTAALELRRAAGRPRRWRHDLLLGVSGLAVWAPMALAVAWAAGQHWAAPALSIPAMVRTHGVANAVAFVLCGLAAPRV